MPRLRGLVICSNFVPTISNYQMASKFFLFKKISIFYSPEISFLISYFELIVRIDAIGLNSDLILAMNFN